MRAASFAWLLTAAASAQAQAPSPDAGVQPAPAPAEESSTPAIGIEALQTQTKQIRDLIRGRLDVAIDPDTLFSVDLDTVGAGSKLESLLKELEVRADEARSRGGRKRFVRSPPLADPREEAQRQLNEAKAAFLLLPASKRRDILERHEKRRLEAAAKATAIRLKTEALERIQAQADEMEAFLAGELDPSFDPAPLLKIDLDDLAELAADPKRRQRFLDPASIEKPPTPSEDADLDTRLDAARQRRDSLWLQFLALDADARRSLLAKHEPGPVTPSRDRVVQAAAAKQVAKEAAKQREKALVDSQLGQTEALRLIADRRARLLAVKEKQAHFKADLASRQTEIESTTESALAWNRRVRELQESLPKGDARSNEADRLYRSLTRDLTDARQALSLALDEATSEPSQVPAPSDDDADQLPANIDDRAIRELRTELANAALSLRHEESEARWDHAQALRDAIVLMNRSRLRLFNMLSKPRRDSLEGFGTEGIAQVERELSTIVLEARFHMLAFPRATSKQVQRLRAAPGPAVVAIVQLLLLLALFRWWRKRADSTLEDLRRSWLQKRPQTQFTRGVATSVWYVRRIRKPLEWLILIVLVITLVSRVGNLPETRYLRIVVSWLVIGALVVEWIDAIASRQGFSSESAAKLRFRSLRMVGVSVVVVGLILSLTLATVGKGAIHAWVIRSLWLLAIPLALVLVFWWKDTIFERAKARESSRLLAWVARHDQGVFGYPVAAFGGAFLFVQGVSGFFVRRVGELAPLRRVFAYLFRRGVEKTTAATPAEYGTEPLPAERCEAFGSRPPASSELVTSYMSDRVHAIRALVRSDNHAIVAVIGERGRGKTTFMNRITSDLEPAELCSVQCKPGGFSVLLAEFARALELPESAPEEDIIAALRKRAPRVIRVDDAQRLVRPLIGGLQDIDHLIRFTRMVGSETSWLIAIGMPAWQYLRRARGDRAAFDRVIELDPWEEGQIASLVQHRTATAGIVPNFEGLVVPRQLQASADSDEQRTQRDFHRILWDYSDGNPEVALHCWQGSLYQRPPDETVYVRLFSRPSAGDLDDLPSTFYFVLRTVVQLELAVEEDVVTCTDLSAAEVADALRAARVNGYIKEHDHLFEIDIHWYRAITSILRRKHLLLL